MVNIKMEHPFIGLVFFGKIETGLHISWGKKKTCFADFRFSQENLSNEKMIVA